MPALLGVTGLAAALLAVVGCQRAPVESRPAASSHPSETAARTPVLTFSGMCDASGAVPVDARYFWVADDEDNVLRLYDAELAGAPLAQVDVSSSLGLPRNKKGLAPEVDIEAATRVGDRAYWLSSHGRNSGGKLKRERLRWFATTISSKPEELRVLGHYENLLSDLLSEPKLAAFELNAAAELAPKAAGGLNLEGMTARKEGGVWIGFRNPIPQGKALLVPLLNPEELLMGKRAVFGEPVTLALSGLGVRALSAHAGRYLIAAGSYDSGGRPQLFAWPGGEVAAPLGLGAASDLTVEAFFSPADREQVLLLSDDGSRSIDGVECKKHIDTRRKQFRGAWLSLPSSP